MNHMQRMRSLEDLECVNHALAHIGGGECTRRFTMGDREVRRGEILTREELLRIPAVNMKALCSNGFISVTLDPASYRRAHNIEQKKGKPNAGSRTRVGGHARKKRGRNKQA